MTRPTRTVFVEAWTVAAEAPTWQPLAELVADTFGLTDRPELPAISTGAPPDSSGAERGSTGATPADLARVEACLFALGYTPDATRTQWEDANGVLRSLGGAVEHAFAERCVARTEAVTGAHRARIDAEARAAELEKSLHDHQRHIAELRRERDAAHDQATALKAQLATLTAPGGGVWFRADAIAARVAEAAREEREACLEACRRLNLEKASEAYNAGVNHCIAAIADRKKG